MKRASRVLTLIVVLAMLMAGDIAPAAQAQRPVRVQLAFVLDGSYSIVPDNWTVMTYGVARALGNTAVVPRDGSVEVCVVQFGLPIIDGANVRQELGPIVLTDQTIGHIQSTIRGIQQHWIPGAYTPTASGIRLATGLLVNSPNFSVAERQVINVATDGLPYDRDKYPDLPTEDVYAPSITDALIARDEAQAAGIDEIDAEVLGDQGQRPSQLQFFTDLVYPKPAKIVPPDAMAPGFARIVIDFSGFEAAITEKLAIVIQPLPTPTLTPTASTTPLPNVTPTPGPSPTPEVPEPGSLALLAGGLTALVGYVGWRRRSGRG